MARVVFRLWGIRNTSDFGEIVFNLVEENLMSKQFHETHEAYRRQTSKLIPFVW